MCLWFLVAYLAGTTILLGALGAADRLFQFSILGETISLYGFRLYAFLLLFGLISLLFMAAWAAYNKRRSRCGERRRRAPQVTMQALARASGLGIEQVLELRGWQVMRAGFNGLFYHYTALPLKPPAVELIAEQKPQPAFAGFAGTVLGLLYRENADGKALYLPIEQIPAAGRNAALRAGLAAYRTGVSVFLFGETLRDILLKRAGATADLLTGCDSAELARLVQRACGGSLSGDGRDRPVELKLPQGSTRCRFFSYQEGGIESENRLRQRLCREDFTIDALACSVTPDKLGRIIDFFGGIADLHRGLVRTLYRLSFVDNPARIFRAIAVAESLGFALEPETERQLAKAVAGKLYRRLSQRGLSAEALRLFQLPDPPAVIDALYHRGLFAVLFPRVRYSAAVRRHLQRVSELFPEPGAPLRTRLYYSALLYRLTLPESSYLCTRLLYNRNEAARVRLILRCAAELPPRYRTASLKPGGLFAGAPPEVPFFMQTLLPREDPSPKTTSPPA